MKLKQHEIEVLEILVSDKISKIIMDEIKSNPNIIENDITDYGYFLTMKHDELPLERSVYDSPYISGKANEIKTGFVVFIENHELTIECHGIAEDVPRDYRERNIKIKPGA